MTSDEKQREILEGIRQFKKDFMLMHDLVPEVRRTHPDHWLGVYEGEVFIAPDYKTFCTMLDERGIPAMDVSYMRVSTREPSIIPPWRFFTSVPTE
ncbi:MAG: hypothetical protein NTZ05_11570 [Chloroflexi bacterium]|nr:hypothetical protein [Chloroflexota bacterium]